MANSAASLQKELAKIAANSTIQAQKLANQATEKSFKYNKEEANTARTWQKMMSDTSHQREVADLKKAGLNPVLAANQGAQSYTTSSASAQANDPSGAAASLAAQQMSGMAQGYSADKSSAATRYAAKQQAAAMKAAAAQSAAAQAYAADRAYAAQKYAWDIKQKMQKYEYEHKPAGNAWTLADKYLSRIGVDASVVKGVKSILKDVKNASLVSVYNGQNDFKLSKVGYQKMNQACTQLGIAQNKNNRYLVYKAINGNQSAINTLKYLTRYPGYKHRSKHQR